MGGRINYRWDGRCLTPYGIMFIMRMRYDEGLDSEEIANYENKHDITPNYDELWNVTGYYLDNDGNDIRDRD